MSGNFLLLPWFTEIRVLNAVKTLIRRRVLRRLIWVYSLPMSLLWDAMLKWVNEYIMWSNFALAPCRRNHHMKIRHTFHR